MGAFVLSYNKTIALELKKEQFLWSAYADTWALNAINQPQATEKKFIYLVQKKTKNKIAKSVLRNMRCVRA